MKQKRQIEEIACDVKRCEVCGCRSRVVDCRPRPLSYWRVLECLRCQHRWDSYESRIDPDDIPPSLMARLTESIYRAK